MKFFPICINTEDKNILIAGGGNVAYRKIKSLLKSELKITAFSIEFSDKLIELAKENDERINLVEKKIDEDTDISGFDFLLIATDDKAANELLAKKAEQEKIFFINSTDANLTDFHLIKVIERNEIVVGLSTQGKNPTLTGIIGDLIFDMLGNLDQEKIELLNSAREILKQNKDKNIKDKITKLYYKNNDEIRSYLEELDENNNWNER